MRLKPVQFQIFLARFVSVLEPRASVPSSRRYDGARVMGPPAERTVTLLAVNVLVV